MENRGLRETQSKNFWISVWNGNTHTDLTNKDYKHIF